VKALVLVVDASQHFNYTRRMAIDLDLYRREVVVSKQPQVRISAIDIHPENPLATLVFIHGFGGYAEQWGYQLEHFAGLGYRVIAPDLRGHGRSSKPPTRYSREEIQADLTAVLIGLQTGPRITLIGHSFGGAIVVDFALTHPRQVERLVLAATPGEFRLNAWLRFAFGLPQTILRPFEGWVHRWLDAPLYVLKAEYRNYLSNWKGWTLFPGLRTPTLVIRGHLDAVFEQPMFEEVSRRIPGAEETDVGASGHMVMLERRQAVNRAILRFITPPAPVAASAPTTPDLYADRPWLARYDPGVPPTVVIPRLPLQQLLQIAAGRFPNQPAIIWRSTRLTYAQLYSEAARCANGLIGLGIRPGDRIALRLPNIPQAVIAFYGALMAGATVMWLPPELEIPETVGWLNAGRAEVLLTLEDASQTLIQACSTTRLRHILLTGLTDALAFQEKLSLRLTAVPAPAPGSPSGDGVRSLAELLAGQSSQPPEIDLHPEDPAAILLTSGASGQRKAVLLSHRNLIANVLQTRHWLPGAVEGGERFLSVVPFSYAVGLTAGLNLPVALGAAIILKSQFEPQDLLESVKLHRPTAFPGLPEMFIRLAATPGLRAAGINSIKVCLSVGDPLPNETLEAFERLTHTRLLEAYGLSEASPFTHMVPLNAERRGGSVGVPLPSTEARLLDLERGRTPVGPGQVGELAVRGPQVMLDYLNKPQPGGRALRPDGWLLTGDAARMDPDGFFRVIDRKSNMWTPRGARYPAFPREIEEVLYEIPQVGEAAVLEVRGRAVAFISARGEPPSSESILIFCRRRLPPEMVPSEIYFVPAIPRGPLGKTLRSELERLYRQIHPR
jgi:long-chain acyl-CoA synthetase